MTMNRFHYNGATIEKYVKAGIFVLFVPNKPRLCLVQIVNIC